MATKPLEARCRRCSGSFCLYRLAEERSGLCPHCGRNFSADWTPHLLEQAARADIAHRHLIDALRELVALPGNLSVKPSAVLHNLFHEVGWQRRFESEHDLLDDELDDLDTHVASWRAVDRRRDAVRSGGRRRS